MLHWRTTWPSLRVLYCPPGKPGTLESIRPIRRGQAPAPRSSSGVFGQSPSRSIRGRPADLDMSLQLGGASSYLDPYPCYSYHTLRMDISELDQFVRYARRVIDAAGPFYPRECTRQFRELTTQCEKCLWYVPDEQYVEHYRDCRWECGLCGERINDNKSFQRHISMCAAQSRTLRGSR